MKRKLTSLPAVEARTADLDEALRLVMELMAIPGLSGEEAAVADVHHGAAARAAAPGSAIRTTRPIAALADQRRIRAI